MVMMIAHRPTTIIKRDGTAEPFDAERIQSAIQKALRATGEAGSKTDKVAEQLTGTIVVKLASSTGLPRVEEVQDLVERTLMDQGWHATAKAYILYRDQRRQLRRARSLVSQELIDHYLGNDDWRVRENANIGFSLQGLNIYLTGAMVAEFWLERVYPQEVREAHRQGDLHLHDLGVLGNYCCGWDLQALLTEGFGGVSGHAEAGPPKHLRSALGQMCNFLYTLQNEAAGAQAFSNVDTLLAPYIRADALSEAELMQTIQEALFNLNTPTRTGGQVPFTNFSFDLFSSPFDLEPALLAGKELPWTYGELQEERYRFVRAFCRVLLAGDIKGRGFTYPVPTFNVTPAWEKGEAPIEVFQLAAKFGSPYFANFINSELSPDDVRSMCCRLRLDKRELLNRGGGLFGADPMTGSIGVVTINLPRLAYRSKGSAEGFFRHLHRQTELAVTALSVRRRALERFAQMGLYPFSSRWLAPVKERFGELFANHFSTIGIVGGNEMCLNLLGVPITDKTGKGFALSVLHFLRERCVEAQGHTGHLFNLEAVPAEGCSYRLARLDKSLYPDITVANEEAWREGAAPYYTNSTHPRVGWSDDPFLVVEHQEELQSLYTGGTVTHFWCGEALPDPQACQEFVLQVCRSSRLPYVTLTPSFSICPTHGYIPGEHFICPTCHEPSEVWSRVVGYYRPVSQYNAGKQAEFGDRASFALHNGAREVLHQ
jgi:anaerobic ribonucleoside-triphosphate reductase